MEVVITLVNKIVMIRFSIKKLLKCPSYDQITRSLKIIITLRFNVRLANIQ